MIIVQMKGCDKMQKFLNEISLVWNDFSEKTRDNWVMILGGLKGKSEVIALMGKEDDR